MLAQPPELETATLRLVRVFDLAEADVNARLVATRGEYTRRTREQQRGAIRAVLAALVELLDPNRGTEAGPAWEVIRTAYRTGSDRALESLGPDANTSLGGPHLEAARLFFENLASRMDDAIAYVGRRVDDHFRRATLEELAVSQLGSRNPRDTAGALERNLRERGVRAFRDSRGAEWKLSTYAENAVRTVSREAHTQATLNRLTENKMDLVKISKSPETCDECKKREGMVYSITGTTSGYPVLEEAPPYHPNCTHAVLPYVVRLAA